MNWGRPVRVRCSGSRKGLGDGLNAAAALSRPVHMLSINRVKNKRSQPAPTNRVHKRRRGQRRASFSPNPYVINRAHKRRRGQRPGRLVHPQLPHPPHLHLHGPARPRGAFRVLVVVITRPHLPPPPTNNTHVYILCNRRSSASCSWSRTYRGCTKAAAGRPTRVRGCLVHRSIDRSSGGGWTSDAHDPFPSVGRSIDRRGLDK